MRRRGGERLPFLIALAIFFLGFVGLVVSLYPYIVPRAVTIWQDKRQMTRFEREAWIITGGAALKVFDLDLGGPVPLRAGITICYDVEFPLIAREIGRASCRERVCQYV